MEIPRELLRAHEDGKVVFFCGAGISYPAGYPTFKPLTENCLNEFILSKDEANKKKNEKPQYFAAWEAYDNYKFDTVFQYLEKMVDGNKSKTDYKATVRKFVKEQLSKPPRLYRNHETLIKLAELTESHGKLVTTNFDHLFEKAYKKKIKDKKFRAIKCDVAPKLGLARPEHLRGLIYLHGRFGEGKNENTLVLNSADFGSAYIYDSWASRFVIELFRHFNVVFIGYSLNDPIMDYLYSAINLAKELSPNHFMDAYIMTSFADDETRSNTKALFSLRGLNAITYYAEKDDNKHLELWHGLERWAENHALNITDKRATVLRLMFKPVELHENFVISDVIWALTDKNVARIIENPKYWGEDHRPDKSWLKALDEHGFFKWTTELLGSEQQTKQFAPLISNSIGDGFPVHEIPRNLILWVTHYLDTNELLEIVIKSGGVMHADLRSEVRRKINQKVQDDSKTKKLNSSRKLFWSILSNEIYAAKLASLQSYSYDIKVIEKGNAYSYKQFIEQLSLLPTFRLKENFFREKSVSKEHYVSDFCEIKFTFLGLNDHDLKYMANTNPDWTQIIADNAISISQVLISMLTEWKNLEDHELIDLKISAWIKDFSENNDLISNMPWLQIIYLMRDAIDAAIQHQDLDTLELLVSGFKQQNSVFFDRFICYIYAGGRNG